MSSKPLHLQDDAVVVDALHGAPVEQLIAVCEGDILIIGYLQAAGQWHRFFLDEGVLFSSEGSSPDLEDDFTEPGEAYVDLLALLGGPATIELFRMHDRTLELVLSTGKTLRVHDDGDDVRYSIRP